MKKVVVGDALVRAINLGDLSFKLKDVNNVPESEWKPNYSDIFEIANPYPSQSFHVALSGASVLVDAGDYQLFGMQDPTHLPKNYTPPPGVIEQLAYERILPEDITHVVITHAHYDHYSGVTKKQNGKISITFPNAKYFLGKSDWEWEEVQRNLKDPRSPESETLGFLQEKGKLNLVHGEVVLATGLKIIPSPGESLGHQIVRLSSHGETLYCVGDLFHHAVEVEHPSWMASWAEADSNSKSREDMIRAALEEDAIIAPAHMPLGKLLKTERGAKFVPL